MPASPPKPRAKRVYKTRPKPPDKTRRELLAEIADLPEDAFISPEQAAAMLGTTTGVLLSWRDQRRGPQFHGFRRFIRYRIADLRWFMAQLADEVAAFESETILREIQVLAITGLSHATLWRRVAAKTFPPPVKLGDDRRGAASGWLRSDLTEWMRSLRREEVKTAPPARSVKPGVTANVQKVQEMTLK